MWARRIHLLELPGFNLLHFSKWPIFWRVFGKNLEKHHNLLPMFKKWLTHPQYPSCWRQGPHKSQPTVEINKWLWEEMSPVSSSTALLNWSIIMNHINDIQWPSSVIIHLNPAFFVQLWLSAEQVSLDMLQGSQPGTTFEIARPQVKHLGSLRKNSQKKADPRSPWILQDSYAFQGAVKTLNKAA